MKHKRHLKQTFVLINLIALLMFSFGDSSIADEEASTISGKVIKPNGEPIADATVVLLYVKLREYSGLDVLYDKTLYPFLRQDPPGMRRHRTGLLPDEQQLREQPAFLKAQTDSVGNFTITDIVPGTVQFTVLPDGIPDKETVEAEEAWRNFAAPPEIKAIKLGKIHFYPHEFSFSPETGAVTFAIKPDTSIEDVEIIMKSGVNIERKNISGKILYEDNTPLANTSVKINIGLLAFGGTSGLRFHRATETDAGGNFVVTSGAPGIYTMSINIGGLSSESDLFIVKDRENYEGVVLKLNGNEEDFKEVFTEDTKSEVNYIANLPNVPNVWVVNPDNGHSYKLIRCGSREEAQNKAEAEEAHLVTINNEEEQIWLEVVFEGVETWIGLSFVVFGSKWEWETGEPLVYTNWTQERDFHGGFRGPTGIPGMEKHFVMMTDEGVWKKVAMEGPNAGRTRTAILEKDGLRVKEPIPLE